MNDSTINLFDSITLSDLEQNDSQSALFTIDKLIPFELPLLTQSMERLDLDDSEPILYHKRTYTNSSNNLPTSSDDQNLDMLDNLEPIKTSEFTFDLNVSRTEEFDIDIPKKKLQNIVEDDNLYGLDFTDIALDENIDSYQITDADDDKYQFDDIKHELLQSKLQNGFVNEPSLIINNETPFTDYSNPEQNELIYHQNTSILNAKQSKNKEKNFRRSKKDIAVDSRINYSEMSESEFEKILKFSKTRKLSYENYDKIYLCFCNNNQYAMKIIETTLPTTVQNVDDLPGKIYIVKMDQNAHGKPQIGINFHGYAEGHYTSTTEGILISCKLVKYVDDGYFLYHFMKGQKKKKSLK